MYGRREAVTGQAEATWSTEWNMKTELSVSEETSSEHEPHSSWHDALWTNMRLEIFVGLLHRSKFLSFSESMRLV